MPRACPIRRQVTTARDMATLGLRLMRDFPQYYPYFRTQELRLQRPHHHGATTACSASYEGTDGIKTGYINASGFNLVSSVRRGDKRLVGVVLGGAHRRVARAYMKKMLSQEFRQGDERQDHRRMAGSSKGRRSPPTRRRDAAPAARPSTNRKTAAAKRLKKKADGTAVRQPSAANPCEQGDTEDNMAGTRRAGLRAEARQPSRSRWCRRPAPVPDAEPAHAPVTG